MTMRRKIALLATTAFVLQGALATMQQALAAQDEDLAAFAYWKMPFGDNRNKAAEPVFGFALSQIHDGWLMAPSVAGVQQLQLPALVDLRFNGGEDELPSLSFSGIDVGTIVGQALHENGPGPAPGLGEWLLIGAGVALGGITACAAAGCFDGGHDNAGGGGEAAGSGAAAASAFAGEDALPADFEWEY